LKRFDENNYVSAIEAFLRCRNYDIAEKYYDLLSNSCIKIQNKDKLF